MTTAVTDELLPCKDCGSPCRVEHFEGPHIEGRVSLWLCSNHKRFGGDCPSDLAYFNEEAWNTRSTASLQTDQVERVARAIWFAKYRDSGQTWEAVINKEHWFTLAAAALQAIEIDEGLRSALEQIKLIGENRRAFDDDRSMWEEMERIASVALSSGEGVGAKPLDQPADRA